MLSVYTHHGSSRSTTGSSPCLGDTSHRQTTQTDHILKRRSTFSVRLLDADIFSYGQNNAGRESQLKAVDNRARKQVKAAVDALLMSVTGKDSTHIPAFTGTYNGIYLKMAHDAALRHKIPVDLFLRLVQQESGWNPVAVSPKGAYGLAQLMPATAQSLRVNKKDPYQNLDGGARYLAVQYREFGSWDLALAAYNAGPEKVKQYGRIPPYKETQNYVKTVLGNRANKIGNTLVNRILTSIPGMIIDS